VKPPFDEKTAASSNDSFPLAMCMNAAAGSDVKGKHVMMLLPARISSGRSVCSAYLKPFAVVVGDRGSFFKVE
jgi:hypothetical protein